MRIEYALFFKGASSAVSGKKKGYMMFKLSPDTDTTGITQMSEIEIAPALIVSRFGLPAQGDGFKVSGEYVFVDLKGNPFVVHDWKSTNLWDAAFPDPEEFWGSLAPEELSISSHDLDSEEFKKWFLQECENSPV